MTVSETEQKELSAAQKNMQEHTEIPPQGSGRELEMNINSTAFIISNITENATALF